MRLDNIKKALCKTFPDIRPDMELDGRGILTLRGRCESYKQVVAVGHAAAKQAGVRNVVNKLTAPDQPPAKDYGPLRQQGLAAGVVDSVDVLIVGAGVTGCGVARELSKYDLNILVAEAGDDVATGATKANNGNIHPGHAVKPGTLKAKLNVAGNRLYTRWAQELGFELQRSGAMGFVTSWPLLFALLYSYRQAKKNGVEGAAIVSSKRARELEPGLDRTGVGGKVKAALWLPSMGLVEPYKVTIALAENAVQNGARFWFNTTVAGITRENGVVTGAITNRGVVNAKYVVNCAGVYADEISAMAGDECYTIHPRRGVIAILDKSHLPEYDSLCEQITMDTVKRTLKNPDTKGGGMCRTPEGNVLMGPSAREIPDKDDLAATQQELTYAMGRGNGSAVYGDIIRYFSGNRPADYKEDFVIEMSPVTRNFVNAGAIQSPGLAAAPAVAGMVENILLDAAKQDGTPFGKRKNWQPVREREPEFRHMTREEQDALIQRDPSFGRVICRCESITEGELLWALRSPVPPASIDALKRRTRAGMGRCQGGFCQPRVVEFLARELGMRWTDVTLRGPGTNVLVCENRPVQKEGDA